MAVEGLDSPDDLRGMLVGWSVFLAVWATLFLEAWRRRQSQVRRPLGLLSVERGVLVS
jgi:hypothetical protein